MLLCQLSLTHFRRRCFTGKRPAGLGTSQYLSDQAQKSILFPHHISCLFLPHSSNKLLPWFIFMTSFARLCNPHLICFWYSHWLLLVHQLLQCWRWKTTSMSPLGKPDTTASFICQEEWGKKSCSVLKLWDQDHLTEIEHMWDLVAKLICLCQTATIFFFQMLLKCATLNVYKNDRIIES